MDVQYITRIVKNVLFIVPVLCVSTTWAISPNWTGGTSTTWATGTNWAGGVAPTALGDTAVFPAGALPAFLPANGASIILDGLNFNAATNSYTVTNGGPASVGTMTLVTTGISNIPGVQQNIINNLGSTLTLQNTATITGANIFITNNGAMNIAGITGAGLAIPSLNGTGSSTISIGNKILTLGAANANDTISSVISGTDGQILKIGSGTLTLDGTNSYTGTTTVSAGTLQLGNGGVTGFVAGNIVDNASVIFNHADSIAYNFVISGTGSLTKLGSGTLTLANTNTYTGGTTVSAGNLIVGSNLLGSLTGDIVDNATLTFARTDDVTYGGVIRGTGQVIKTGGGILTLTGDNTYTGLTQLPFNTNAILQLGNGGVTGSVASNIEINGGSTLIFNRSDNPVYAGVFTGTGESSIRQAGSGTLILTGDSTPGSTLFIDAGTVQFGNGGATGIVNTNIVNNSNLVFKHFNNVVFPFVMSGTGSMTQAGTGTLILTSSNNAVLGGVTISAGALQLGNGGTDGSITTSIVNNAQLIFNRADVFSVTAPISGTGSVIQNGEGTVLLLSDNSYTGGTIVNAGILHIGNGTAAGRVVGDIVNNSVVFFDRPDNQTYAGNISGSGIVQKLNDNVLLLTGDNTYTGQTTVIAGQLQIGNGGTTGSLVSDIALSFGQLDFNRSNNFTYAGVISGNGPVLQDGTGTVTLTANNTNIGTLFVNQGAVQIGNRGTTGNYNGAISNNGALIFNRSNPLVFSYAISGVGSVTQAGSNTLTFLANNNYLGLTTINNGGTLQLGGGGTSGFLNGDILNNGVLAFNRADNPTYTGIITGSGLVNQIGTGILTFTADNTYTGLTTVSSGALQLGNGTISGSVLGNIVNNSAVIFNNTVPKTYNGVISGSGVVLKAGGNDLTFTNANTYTGVTKVVGGVLHLGNPGGITGSIAGDILNNATVNFERSDIVTYGGTISGTGTVAKTGTQGTLVLTGNNIYTGNTVINAGTTLQLGNGGATGSVVSANILNAGSLVFNLNNTQTYRGTISGIGSLTQAGTGTLILTADHPFTGNVTVQSGGTLQLGVGSEMGSVNTDITNNGMLIFNHANDYNVENTISGVGQVQQVGTGTVTLNSVNTYTGLTSILSGKMLIGDTKENNTAKVAGSVVISSGATLGGFGTVGGQLTNNGTISPGASIGTFNVTGNYIQSAHATYVAEVDGLGHSDVLNVTGTATLNGTLQLDATAGFIPGFQYTLINAAGGVTGQFANVDVFGQFNQNFLTGQVQYQNNAVLVSPSLNAATLLASVRTANQRTVIKALIAHGGTPALQAVLGSVTSVQQLYLVADQTSAAFYGNQELQIAQTSSWFTGQMMDRMDLYPHSRQPSLWIAPYGSGASLSVNDVSGLDTGMGGLAIGAAFPVQDTATVGMAIGTTYFNNTAEGNESGSGNGLLYQFGVYADYAMDHWLLAASADVGGSNNVDSTRDHITSAAPDLTVTTDGSYSAMVLSQQARVSYDFLIQNAHHIRPFVGVVAQELSRDSFAETGDEGFAVNVDQENYNSFKSQVGSALEVPLTEQLKFISSLAWQHEFADDHVDVNSTLVANPAEVQDPITSVTIGRDSAQVKAGFMLVQKDMVSISALYQGTFADAYQENGGKIQVDFRLE